MTPKVFSTRALLVALVALLVGIPAWVAAQLGGGGLSGGGVNASLLTSGTLPDARLSANVPLLNAANTFTAAQSIAVSGTGGSNVFAGNGWSMLVLSDTAAAANQKRVRFIQDAGVLSAVSESDAGSGISTLLQATTDGAGAWTEFRVDAAAFDFNGAADFSSTIAANGVDITPSSGTFVASFATACTTTPTATFDYQRIGNLVTMWMVSTSGFPCTADSSGFSASAAIPAALRPAGLRMNGITSGCEHDGVVTVCNLLVNNSGDISIQRCDTTACGGGAWTSSGNRTLNELTGMLITYGLGNP